MLPGSLYSSYRSYKENTNTFTTWLDKAGRAVGFTSPSASLVPASKHSSSTPAKDKPLLTTTDILKCAEVVAANTKSRNGREIPRAIAKAAQAAIDDRKKFSKWFSQQQTMGDLDEQLGHDFFITTLEHSLRLLLNAVTAPSDKQGAPSPRPAKPIASKILAERSLNGLARSENRYSVLALQKVKDRGGDPSATSKVQLSGGLLEKTPHARCQGKSVPAKDDALFAIFLTLEDLHALAEHVMDLWEQYGTKTLDLVTAALTTDAAYELASQLVADLEFDYPGMGNWQTVWGRMKSHDLSSTTPRDLVTSASLQPPKANGDLSRFEWIFGDMAAVWTKVFQYPVPITSVHALQIRDDKFNEPSREQTRNTMTSIMERLVRTVSEITRINAKGSLPLEDHFLHILKKPMDLKIVSLQHIFMAQLFFDIMQILPDASRPRVDLYCSLNYIHETIIKNENDSVADSNCRECNSCGDEVPNSLIGLCDQMGCLNTFYQLQELCTLVGDKSNLEKDPLLPLNPVLCGLHLCHIDTWFQSVCLKLVNDSEVIMGLAHLYNACRVTSIIKKDWLDMELIIKTCRESRVFFGARPTEPVSFRKRYILAAGMSVRAFASNRKGNFCEHSQRRIRGLWTGAEHRRRLLEVDTPLVSCLYRVDPDLTSYITSDVRDIINPAMQGKRYRDSITAVEYLDRITDKLREEVQRNLINWLWLESSANVLLDGIFALEEALTELDARSLADSSLPRPYIIYDILTAASFTCPECRHARGSSSILPEVGGIIESFLGFAGYDTSSKVVASRWKQRVPKAPKVTIPPPN